MQKKVIFSIVIIMTLLSCRTALFQKKFNILFASGYENERCTLIVDGDTIMKSESIITDRSLGIDLSRYYTFDKKSISIKLIFNAILDEEWDVRRTVSIDTILDVKNGWNVLIFARSNNINIIQQNSKFILE
jgi:hypothetical protein